MVIKIMVGEPVVLPKGYAIVRWTVDMSNAWFSYDGVFLKGAEPNKEHSWRIRIVDCMDVQAMMRVMTRMNPFQNTFEVEFIRVLPSAHLQKEAENPCCLPPPLSLDEL